MLTAYSRLKIRGAQLTTQHLVDAYQESNLLLVEWANRQPNLWTEDIQSQVLTQGTSTYVMNANTVAVLICYLTVTTGGTSQDYVLGPISGQDYASYPTKTQQGRPTVFYFERLETPQITVWPVPDNAATYTLNWRRCRQVQDASIKGGVTLDTPYRWLDAFTAGLSHRLSRMYAPELEQMRKGDAVEAWGFAAREDQEDVPYQISMGLESYYN